MPITLVVTAMDRLELLEKTLTSFVAHNTYPIEEMIIRDDSGLYPIWSDTRDLLYRLDLPFPFRLLKCENLGQIRSIDTLMGEVGTDLVFHTEDDWEFTRTGFIEDCIKVIDDATQVWVRNHDDGVVVKKDELKEMNGVEFYEVERFSFNPHLRKISDYTKYEDFTGWSCYEEALTQGAKTRWLKNGACRHIGGHKPCNRGGLPYQVRKA